MCGLQPGCEVILGCGQKLRLNSLFLFCTRESRKTQKFNLNERVFLNTNSKLQSITQGKLSMNKFVSFSAEGKYSVEINTERLHTVPADTVSSVCISCFLVHIYLAGTCYLGLEINGFKPNINTTFEA